MPSTPSTAGASELSAPWWPFGALYGAVGAVPLAYGHCYAYAAGTGALVNIHGHSTAMELRELALSKPCPVRPEGGGSCSIEDGARAIVANAFEGCLNLFKA